MNIHSARAQIPPVVMQRLNHEIPGNHLQRALISEWCDSVLWQTNFTGGGGERRGYGETQQRLEKASAGPIVFEAKSDVFFCRLACVVSRRGKPSG